MEINLIYLIIGSVFAIALITGLIVLFFISRKSQKVMESLLILMTRPERAKIQDASRVLQTIMSDEINKIESSFKSIQETLKSQIASAEFLNTELTVKNTDLVGIADEATRKISNMSGRLDNTLIGLRGIVESNGWTDIENTINGFSSRVNELLGKIDTTVENVMDKTTVAQNQIDKWTESTKILSANLESASHTNISQMQEITTGAELIQQKISDISASAVSGFNDIKTSSADYEKIMETNDKLLGTQIQKIDVFTKQSKTLLNNQMNTLTNTANVVGGQIRLAESSIEKQIRKLAESVEVMMSSATTTESAVRNISNELAVLTNRFNNEIKEFSTGIVGELKTVSGVANITLENTKNSAGAFSESVRAMALGVRETLMEMNTAHTQLTGQSVGLIKMSAETTAQLQPLSELIEKYYVALPELSSGSIEMAKNLENIVASMNDKIKALKETAAESLVSMSDSSLRLENISGQSRGQMIDLMSDYAKAVNTMQTLNKQMMVARATAPMDAIRAAPSESFGRISSGDFIKQSEKLIDKMHEQTLDLTRTTGAEIPDAIWKKYHAGDATIFSKWLAKMLTAADKKRIGDMLKSDTVFRSQATQFVRSFDKIINAAKQSDNSEMLTATLTKTELGQIYTALKNHL